MKINKPQQKILLIFITIMATVFSSLEASSLNKTSYMRIAGIVIDPARLKNYKAALKEGMEAAVRKEPGILCMKCMKRKIPCR
jgi:hypothetical protein